MILSISSLKDLLNFHDADISVHSSKAGLSGSTHMEPMLVLQNVFTLCQWVRWVCKFTDSRGTDR